MLSTCQIAFLSGSDRTQLQAAIPMLKSHFARMRAGCGEGSVSRFSGRSAYRLVSALAEFNPDYHCVDDVLFDSDNYESACRVSFGQMKKGGDFFINPGAIDGLTQSAGFTMNANERTRLETDVFVNHGWTEFQLFEKINDDSQYWTYVKMTESGVDNLWTGDISVFTEGRPVALVRGVQVSPLSDELSQCSNC